jgi:putative ABC transport system permease protein
MIERVYRALLWLFPAEFRERFADELLATTRDIDRRGGHAHSSMRAVIDAITAAFAVRADLRAEALQADATSSYGRRPMNSFLRDVYFAWRGLRRDPLFTAFAVITLALGIGANATMFGIADRLLLRGPEHVRDAARVVRVYVTEQPAGMKEFTTSGFGNVTVDVIRRATHVAEGVAAYTVNDGTLGRGADARPIRLGYASGSFFPLLGVRPVLGRFFSEQENAASGAAHVVVLSYGLWQTQFGGDHDVLGRTITVRDEPFIVIGVAPPGFTGAELAPVNLWAPINLTGPRIVKDWQTSWNAQWLHVIVRLNPGVTFDRAAAELTALHRAAYTGNEKSMAVARISVAPLSANDSGTESTEATVVRWLAGVALIVLLIACANVTNLLLARGVRRGRESAIRLALGASRLRLVRLMLVESTMLAIGGAVAGIALAYILGGIARHTLLSDIEWTSSPVDVRVLAVSAVIALGTGILVGLIPALRGSSARLATALKSGTQGSTGERARLRNSLTIVQTALSVALLIGAGLFVRSFWNVRTLHLGLDPDRVLVVELYRPSLANVPDGPPKDAERTRRRTFFTMAGERVGALPGVEHAAIAVGLPFGNRFTVTLRVPGRDSLPHLKSGSPSVSAVSADYFAAMGTRIVRGRGFTTADRAGSEFVTVVSARMAATIWPGTDPLGACLLVGAGSPPCTRVVGIAEDTYRSGLREEPPMQYYIPLGQEVGFGGSVILVRGAGDPRVLGGDVRRAILALDPTITYVSMETIQERIDPQMRPWKLGAAVFAVTGLLALLVAAVGLYSVMSYLVVHRTREIGVRIAIGADRAHITGLVLRGGFAMAMAGIVIGAILAAASSRLVEPLLFNESARDPWVFVAVSCVLALVALAASLIPAARANRIDPLEALRAD